MVPDNTVLQSFVLPDEARSDRTALYARYTRGPVRLCGEGGLLIAPDARIDFTTFFNAFSHRKWRDQTGLERLSLRLYGEGDVEVVVVAFTASAAGFDVHRSSVRLHPDGLSIEMPALSGLPGEIIGLTLCGTAGESVLRRADWTTSEPAKRSISLAAVITTFGRHAAVRRSMDTFSQTICARSRSGPIDLYIIDNERCLDLPSLDHVKVVPNANLGGAGGFTRGLIEAMESGDYSHVLFMDDDAACEPESVWRTMMLLAYASNPATAVAGAMLLAGSPHVQNEKGAWLDKTGATGSTWRGNRPGIDLSRLLEICNNEADDFVNYGAWWFFAYPIACVRSLPFPFFVRGDDVDFSLTNDFAIVTLNGVATWCDSFATKTGPETEYLAARAWMALALMHGTWNAAFLALWNTLKLARTMALRFDYAAMNAVIDAVEDAISGPDVFTRDPAPLAKLKRYKARRPCGTLGSEDFMRLTPQRHVDHNPAIVARTSRNVAASGSPDPIWHAVTPWEVNERALAGSKRSAYGEGTELFVFKRDRAAFLRGRLRLTKALWLGRLRLAGAQRRYKDVGPTIRSRSFWDPLLLGE